jgi:hypothetical protein
MGPLDLLPHLLGFMAPAFFLALALPTAARWLLRRPAPMAWWLQVAVVFAAGLLVLGAGLWWFGRDGKMATYAALVAVAASVQWLAMRAWR